MLCFLSQHCAGGLYVHRQEHTREIMHVRTKLEHAEGIFFNLQAQIQPQPDALSGI